MKKKQIKQQCKPVKAPRQTVKSNADFLSKSAHALYLTENSIAIQRVTAVNRAGEPTAIRTDYYDKTPERMQALRNSRIRPGKPIRVSGSDKRRSTTFLK